MESTSATRRLTQRAQARSRLSHELPPWTSRGPFSLLHDGSKAATLPFL